MNGLMPLWAAGWEEIIPIVLGILFILVPAIGQMLVRGRQPQQPGGQAGGQAQPPQRQLQDEIGEFLRRAARARAQAQAGQQRPTPGPAPQPARPIQPRTPQPAKPIPRQRPAQQPVVKAEVVQPQLLNPDELAKRVAKDIDTSRLERRTRELGQGVARADQKTEQRRQQVFKHTVGRLATASESAAPAPQAVQPELDALPRTSAAGLAVLLSNVQNLRQAILLNEILRRPEERWL